MSKIRVLIVEPGKEPYEAKIENTLGTLQSIVDGYQVRKENIMLLQKMARNI